MVEDDEVARLEVEAVQAVAGAFGVVHVFIDDVGGAFGVGCDALADLPGSVCVSGMYGGRCRIAWRGLIAGVRIPDWAEFAEQVKEFFGADGVAEVLDKERSGEVSVELFRTAKIGGEIAVETDLFTSGASLEFLLIAWLVFVGVVDCVLRIVLVRERVCGGEDSGMVGLESSTRAVGMSVCRRDPLSGAEVLRQPRARQQMAAACPRTNQTS